METSKQQISMFQRHRLSLSLTTITLQCNVGFLLNTFSKSPIISPYKTNADYIGGLFYPPVTPRPFVTENMFQLNATGTAMRQREREYEKREGKE